MSQTESQFLQVANVRNLVNALAQLRTRDFGVPGLGIVIGPPGRGKTESAIWYAANKNARYILANTVWTPRWMMNDFYLLAKGLRQGPKIGTTQKAWELTLPLLEGNPEPILIDEADRLCRDIKLLEMVRDIHDRTGVPIVMIGTDVLAGRLAQHDRFWRRVTASVEFEPLSAEEIRLAVHKLAGLQLDQAGAQAITLHTKGQFGELMKALPAIKKILAGNQVEGAPPVELIDSACKKALKRAA